MNTETPNPKTIKLAGGAHSEESGCLCGCGEATPIAGKTDSRRQMVKGQPCRFIPGHHMRLNSREMRYRVEDHGYESECWIWTNAVDGQGYGRVQRNGKRVAPHRWVYEQLRGPIPEGLELDHLCRVRNCVNPQHLEPVTPAENSRRARTTKLTSEQAEQIRRSEDKQSVLAERFGVSRGHISDIQRGTKWADAQIAQIEKVLCHV